MKKILTISVLILSILVSHFFVFNFSPIQFAIQADTDDVEINPSEYLVLSDGKKVSDVFSTPADMVNLLVRVVFVLVGLILFAMIVFSGFSMIAGGGSENKEKAKTTMTSALIGFLLIFAAYWIMQIIKIFTGADIGF
jgi:amino acid transporter